MHFLSIGQIALLVWVGQFIPFFFINFSFNISTTPILAASFVLAVYWSWQLERILIKESGHIGTRSGGLLGLGLVLVHGVALLGVIPIDGISSGIGVAEGAALIAACLMAGAVGAALGWAGGL